VQICRLDEQTVVLTGLDLFSCELLNQIPVSAQAEESGPVQTRFFMSPTAGTNADIDEDWKTYVEPELRQIFQSALEVVRDDLADFPPSTPEESYTLPLPVSHLPSWINALNQARIALAAVYSVTEEDMERLSLAGDARALALYQIHFYGRMQEYFLLEVGAL
jgi:Domain of unknown function (DUF2017)